MFIGSCNSPVFDCILECKDQEVADEEAWRLACDDFDSYAGLHGLRDESQIAEEEELDEEEDAEEIRGIYEEERESQLDYRAVLVPDDLPEDENSVNEYVDSLDKKDEE